MNKKIVIEGLKLKGYDVELIYREKNGITKQGLINKSAGNVCPVLYIDDFEYLGDTEAIEKIAKIFDTAEIPAIAPDLNFISNFNEKSLRIAVCKRGNAGRDTLVRPFLDMDIYAVIQVFDDETTGMGTVKINKEILDTINKTNGTDYTPDDIIDKAIKQSIDEGFLIKPIIEMIKNLMREKGTPEEFLEILPPTPFPMYVITTQRKTHGAAAFLSTRHLDAVCALENVDKLFILPSSIHELIVVADKQNDLDAATLRQMVVEINGSEVLPEEVLTDSVYVYDAKTKEVTIANE